MTNFPVPYLIQKFIRGLDKKCVRGLNKNIIFILQETMGQLFGLNTNYQNNQNIILYM